MIGLDQFDLLWKCILQFEILYYPWPSQRQTEYKDKHLPIFSRALLNAQATDIMIALVTIN